MASKGPRQTAARESPAARIVSTALVLAEEKGWGAVSLSDIASQNSMSLARLFAHFPDKNAIADAWFELALTAMLAPMPRGFSGKPADERVHYVMMRWFDALSLYRCVTGEMLDEKRHPPHPHHWVPMIFDLSRLVQLMRDAARLETQGRRRQLEEVGLTTIFLATLWVWRRDETSGQQRTRDFLSDRLRQADNAMARFFPLRLD